MKKSFNELIVEKLSNNIDYAWINIKNASFD